MAQRKSSAKRPRGVKSSQRTPTASFSRWKAKKSPPWHPIKKMRYVFWRIQAGVTVMDALREIHWSMPEFWNLVDSARVDNPFQREYDRARKIQARAFSDQIVRIAEGRDHISKANARIIKKTLQRMAKSAVQSPKKSIMLKIIAAMNDRVMMNRKDVIARNRLQIEAAKWIAKAGNPLEFSEKNSLALTTPDGLTTAPVPIAIQFIGPDGKAVKL